MRNFFSALLGKKSPEFFEVIKGRKSVKYFDTDVKIKREEIIEMLDEANIAPSSCNLQPWRYIVVDTPEGKEKLGSANYNKIQNYLDEIKSNFETETSIPPSCSYLYFRYL